MERFAEKHMIDRSDVDAVFFFGLCFIRTKIGIYIEKKNIIRMLLLMGRSDVGCVFVEFTNITRCKTISIKLQA